jgi:hypothetical protein
MAGFIEFNVVCPDCKEKTGILDVGKDYEDYKCTNEDCNSSHSFQLPDFEWIREVNQSR